MTPSGLFIATESAAPMLKVQNGDLIAQKGKTEEEASV